jgi:hypothetical protein
MTDEELKAIRERLAKASPGPWRLFLGCEDQVAVGGPPENPLVCTVSKGHGRPHGEGNADFIVNAPADVSALLAEVERLNRERIECPRCLYEFRLDGVPVDQ